MNVASIYLGLIPPLLAASAPQDNNKGKGQGVVENFDGPSSSWHSADGWTNGDPFNNGWRSSQVTFQNGIMTLTLDNVGCPSLCSGKPYASGEYRSNQHYQYGTYEVRMKAAKADGIVSSFFTYTGPSEGNPWDEIDIEILGKDPTSMQVNYWTNGVGGHETIIPLGFDASQDFHTYAFKWEPGKITWMVDGKIVHTETGSRGALPTHAGRIIMNLWPGTGVDSWLNPFRYTGPLTAQYDWVRFTPLGGVPKEVTPAVTPLPSAIEIPAVKPPAEIKKEKSKRVLPLGQADPMLGRIIFEGRPKLKHLLAEKHLELDQLEAALKLIASAPENRVLDPEVHRYSRQRFEELYPELAQIKKLDQYYDYKIYGYLCDFREFWNNTLVLLSVYAQKVLELGRKDKLKTALEIADKFEKRIAFQKMADQATRKERAPTDYSQALLKLTAAELRSQLTSENAELETLQKYYEEAVSLIQEAVTTLLSLQTKTFHPSKPDYFSVGKAIIVLASLYEQLANLTGKAEYYQKASQLYGEIAGVVEGKKGFNLTVLGLKLEGVPVDISPQEIEAALAFNLERGYISQKDTAKTIIGIYHYLKGMALIKGAGMYTATPQLKSVPEIKRQIKAAETGVAEIRTASEKVGVPPEKNRFFFEQSKLIRARLLLILANRKRKGVLSTPQQENEKLAEQFTAQARKLLNSIPKDFTYTNEQGQKVTIDLSYLNDQSRILLLSVEAENLALKLKKKEAGLAEAESLLKSARSEATGRLSNYGEYWNQLVNVLILFTQAAIEESSEEKLKEAFQIALQLKERFKTIPKLNQPSDYSLALLDLTLAEIYSQTNYKPEEFYREGIKLALAGVNKILSLPTKKFRPSAPDYFSVGKGIAVLGDLFMKLATLSYREDYYKTAHSLYHSLALLTEASTGFSLKLNLDEFGTLSVKASPEEIRAALDSNMHRGYLHEADVRDAAAGIYHYLKGVGLIKNAGLFVAWPRRKELYEIVEELDNIQQGVEEIKLSAQVVGVAPEKNQFFFETTKLLQGELLLALADRINYDSPEDFPEDAFFGRDRVNDLLWEGAWDTISQLLPPSCRDQYLDRRSFTSLLFAVAEDLYHSIPSEYPYLYACARVKILEIAVRNASYVSKKTRRGLPALVADAKRLIEEGEKEVQPLLDKIRSRSLMPEYVDIEFDYLQSVFYLAGYPSTPKATENQVFAQQMLERAEAIEQKISRLPADAHHQRTYFRLYAQLKKAEAYFHLEKYQEAYVLFKELEKEVAYPLPPYIFHKLERWEKILFKLTKKDREKHGVKTFAELLRSNPKAAQKILARNITDLTGRGSTVLRVTQILIGENLKGRGRAEELIARLIEQTKKIKLADGQIQNLEEARTTHQELLEELEAIDASAEFAQQYGEVLTWDLDSFRAELYHQLALVYACPSLKFKNPGDLTYEYVQSTYWECQRSTTVYDNQFRPGFLHQNFPNIKDATREPEE